MQPAKEMVFSQKGHTIYGWGEAANCPAPPFVSWAGPFQRSPKAALRPLGWAWEFHSTSKCLNHVWNVDAWILKVTAIWSTWWGPPWHSYELMLWLEQWVSLAFEAFVWVWIPACKPHSSELSHFHFGKLDRADSKVCAASRNITNKEMKIIPFKKNKWTNKQKPPRILGQSFIVLESVLWNYRAYKCLHNPFILILSAYIPKFTSTFVMLVINITFAAPIGGISKIQFFPLLSKKKIWKERL